MIDTPGIVDLDEATYHGDPAPTPSLSAGTAKRLLEATPRHAADQHPRLKLPDLPDEADDSDPKFDLGKACHAIVTGKGGEIVEVEADSWRSKDAKAARDEANAAGNTALLAAQAERVRLMARLLDQQMRRSLGRNPFADRENNELAMFWTEGDIWCRAKPDALDYQNRIAWDLKTTEALADPDGWTATQLRATSIDLRAAHYLRGTKRLIGPGWRYLFVVAEARRPHAISIVELPGALLDVGEDMRQRAVTIWTRCIASGEWPGWSERITVVEAPAYHEARWLERRERHPSAAALAAAAAAQAPNRGAA